jgi:hypothetical protein
MYTLIVNGVPALKLKDQSEIPSRRGHESWRVVDDQGNTIDHYLPFESSKRNVNVRTRSNSEMPVRPVLAAIY